MRNMSFFLTTEQIKNKTKDITRRFGWWFLKPGDRVCAVQKGQGLKKGEKIKRICVIEIVSLRSEPIDDMTQADCIREGFPEMTPIDFVGMITKHYGVSPKKIVNRIEFKYI